jgi:hypothetical protein
MVLRGKYIITTPNSRVIFDPPLGADRMVFLRSNLLFGEDDPMQWPQPWVSEYPHVCCILHQPSTGMDSLSIMWSFPERCDFVEDDGIICGVGKINVEILAEFQ